MKVSVSHNTVNLTKEQPYDLQNNLKILYPIDQSFRDVTILSLIPLRK